MPGHAEVCVAARLSCIASVSSRSPHGITLTVMPAKQPTAANANAREFHTLRVPLRVNPREQHIIRQRLLVVGLLKRAFLRMLLRRVNAMHRDPDWAAARELPAGSAQRSVKFNAVREKHGLALSQMDASELCKALWRGASHDRTREFSEARTASRELASALHRPPRKERAPLGWMPSVFAARVAGAAGREVWKSVEESICGRRGLPRVKSPHLNRTAWNEDNKSGMFLDGDHLVWNQASGSRRKDLRLKLGKRQDSVWWDKRITGRRVLAVGICEDAGTFYALLRMAGAPYRDPNYLAAVAHGESVGMDAAPTSPAFVGPAESFVGSLASKQALARQHELSRHLRRLQRAQDRSRRATNPDCFDSRGRAVKGKRPRRRSNTYRRRQARLRQLQRRAAAQRRTDAERLTRQVMTLGTNVAVEKTNHRAWQRSGLKLGRRMQFTRPGEMYARLRSETALLGGGFVELPTGSLALSQHCLCGARVRKALSQRVHSCSRCGIGPLHRDLFSAFLAQLVLSSGLAPGDIDLSEGLFDSPDSRTRAGRLCGVPNTGHKGAGHDADTSRLAPLVATNQVTAKAVQSACQGSVSDLAPTSTGAAGRRSRSRDSEETRPPVGHVNERGPRTTTSGGGTTLSGLSPPAVAHLDALSRASS